MTGQLLLAALVLCQSFGMGVASPDRRGSLRGCERIDGSSGNSLGDSALDAAMTQRKMVVRAAPEERQHIAPGKAWRASASLAEARGIAAKPIVGRVTSLVYQRRGCRGRNNPQQASVVSASATRHLLATPTARPMNWGWRTNPGLHEDSPGLAYVCPGLCAAAPTELLL